MTGETIGQYRLEKKLGEGGVGEVFKAVDLMLSRVVAIKRLRPELAAREQVVERFRAEARTLAQLHHPNIAMLYSFENDQDSLYMVMEYVDGQTLADLLRSSGRLPLSRALFLFFQALDGIGAAHELGIVHRDIKGSNLILGPTDVIKVMDFGIARMMGSERMTQIGQLVGTPEYMSPEQVRGEEADARSDLYSLGVLLYALLSGCLPFASKSNYDLMRSKVESQAPPLSRLVRNLPTGLNEIVQKALRTEPDDRFQNTGDFRRALEPLLAVGDEWARGTGGPRRTGWLPTSSCPDTPPEGSAQATRVLHESDTSTLDEPPLAGLRALRRAISTGLEASAQGWGTRLGPSIVALRRVVADRRSRLIARIPTSLRGPVLAGAVLLVLLVSFNLLWIARKPDPTPSSAENRLATTQQTNEASPAAHPKARPTPRREAAEASSPAEESGEEWVIQRD